MIRSYISAQEKESTRRAEKVLKKYWNSFKTISTKKKILSTTGISLVFLYLYFSHDSPGALISNTKDVFKKGKIDLQRFDQSMLIKRETLENEMKSTLQPSSGGSYSLIVGEHGTGKTTLIRKTILNLQEPKGVVLFECPTDANAFATNLTRHLDCELYPLKLRDIIMQWITNARRKEHTEHLKYSTWHLLKGRLINTAFRYKREYKRPMVLVLDQVDRIAKKDREFLGILQDFAKDCADKHTLVIIFVASEGLVPQLMRSRSAWSRAIIPFEVGDISDEEAVKLLEDSGTDQKTAKDAVKYLTGGRFALLSQFQSLSQYEANPKILFEELKEQMFTQIMRDLNMVGLPENHEFFIKLIEMHRIHIKQAITIIPLNMLRKLVEANILKEHKDYTVSFHSRYVNTYFKEVNKS